MNPGPIAPNTGKSNHRKMQWPPFPSGQAAPAGKFCRVKPCRTVPIRPNQTESRYQSVGRSLLCRPKIAVFRQLFFEMQAGCPHPASHSASIGAHPRAKVLSVLLGAPTSLFCRVSVGAAVKTTFPSLLWTRTPSALAIYRSWAPRS